MPVRTESNLLTSTDIYGHKDNYTGEKTDMYNIFGTTQIIIGDKDLSQLPHEQIERLVYDLQQKVYHKCLFPLDLETGGSEDTDLPGGKKNWFPGCDTYGILLSRDGAVFDNDKGIGAPLEIIYRKDARHTATEASVKILDVLDAINTSTEWKTRMNIYYHVETRNGVRGYINASLVDKVVYIAHI